MVYDAIGTMFMNIGLFGGGIALAIAGLIIGATRGMTKNSDLWAITFSAFAFLISMIIPNTPWALTIWLLGGIGLMVSFLPLLEKLNDSNIFTIAIIFMLTNIILVISLNAYNESFGWQDNIEEIQSDLATMMGDEYNAVNSGVPDHGLCTPEQQNNGECDAKAEKGSFNPLIFDVFASILAMGDYIAKAIKLGGMAVLGPFIVASILSPKLLIVNPIIYWLMTFFAFMIEVAILYKVIAFILNKRGMK